MTSPVTEARLWYVNRIAAMVLALCVVGHLLVIVYAVRGGLTGAEILARTRGNWAFGAFYAVFVLACVLHVPLSLAKVAEEWLGLGAGAARALAAVFALVLLVMGLRAVAAVVLP